MNSTMITPITAPGRPPRSNASLSPMPSTSVKKKKPSRAPTTPKITVMKKPMSCLPGMISRPRYPAMMPMMIAAITATCPLSVSDAASG